MSLTLSTEIPYGNAALVTIDRTESMNRVYFAADPHGGLERLWFCFRLNNDSSDLPKTKLVLKHFETMLGGNRNPETASVITPVIRYKDKTWERMAFATPELTPDGRMELSWIIDTPKDYADIAICYPYGFPEVDKLITDSDGYWQKDEIGISQEGNPIIRLSNSCRVSDKTPGLYLLARQHAGEVGGSWVLDGFLRYLAEIKSNILVWCTPLANIDGVLNGDYGKNPFPHDLNRAWSATATMRHEVKVLMQDQLHWQTRCQAAQVMDFHCPAIAETTGIYTFIAEDDQDNKMLNNRLNTYASALENYADPDFIHVSTYMAASTWGQHPCMRQFVKDHLKIPSITFECSYMQANGTVLTIENYQEMGRILAKSTLAQIQ
jgi:hypothetical protein